MKAIIADLLEDVVTTYDQTKTTVFGNVSQRTISGEDVLGPPLSKWLDVFTDSGTAPVGAMAISPYTTANVTRVFVLGAEAAGVSDLMLYTFNVVTGASAYVGKVRITTPDNAATTTTFRSLKVDDSGTTGWKIFVNTTGSVLINGGIFMVNSMALADFVPVGFPTIPFATGNGQKAVYNLQDPANVGVGHLMTASAGVVVDSVGQDLYVMNGIAATYQFYVFDYSIAPTWVSAAVTGTAATDIIAHAGHTFLDNDPIVFTATTGGTGIVVGTVYYVRTSVPGVSYQISTTTGGAVLNFTTDLTAATVGRAFGTSTVNFTHKTGNLPALTGTLLINGSVDFANPASGANAGFDCAAFGTTSNLYLGKLSELTVGAVTWPSLATANLLGAVSEVVAPVAVTVDYDTTNSKFIYSSNTSTFYIKPLQNNLIDESFGGVNTAYYEGLTPETPEFGVATLGNTANRHGWQLLTGTAIGQRGVLAINIGADSLFDSSYLITKVLNTPSSQLKALYTLEKLYDFTNINYTEYRTSGFGSATGGWILLDNAEDLSAIATGDQIQFRVTFSLSGVLASNPAQLYEIGVVLESLNEISDNWEYSHDDSSNGNPSIVAFRLKEAYTSTVPTIYFRAYDTSDVLIAQQNTSANPSFFEYSTDGGVNWIALGTIPNTVGTLIRYTFTTPPGVDVRPSVREA